MKTFAGTKPWCEIAQQCKDQGLIVDDSGYQLGGDWIYISGGGCRVSFNTVNGNFMGTTPEGVDFWSSNTKFENQTWFQALLAFFYIEKAEDCDVMPREMIELGSKLRFDKPWLVQFGDGKFETFDTEIQAYTRQREHRASVGLNPMTGEPA